MTFINSQFIKTIYPHKVRHNTIMLCKYSLDSFNLRSLENLRFITDSSMVTKIEF